MKLIKSLVLNFKDIPKDWKHVGITYGDISLQTHNTGNLQFILVSAATILCELPVISSQGLIKLPLTEIKRLEQSIETIANFISLAGKLPRSISASNPSIFLSPESEEDQQYLDNAIGFDFDEKKRVLPEGSEVKFDLAFCLKNLKDRMDGVDLIAEANSSLHLSGKLHEYIRFYERAFKRENRGLIEPLAEFLTQNKVMGYDKKEVTEWISIRNKSIHANGRDGFLVEADLRPYIKRIEQACYEVLFNKKNWADSSTSRRDLHKIDFGTKNSSNSLFITQGSEGMITLQLFDETGSYPLNLKANLTTLPERWWAPIPKELRFNEALGEIVKDDSLQ